MAVNDRAIRLFIERWLKMQRTIGAGIDVQGAAAGNLLDGLVRDMFRVIGAETNGTGAAIAQRQQIEAILAAFDERMAQVGDGLSGIYRDNFKAIWEATAADMPGVVSMFGQPDARRLREAVNVFRVEKLDAHYQTGFVKWRQTFSEIGGDLRSTIQEKLFNAELNGWDQARTARELVQSGKFWNTNLPELGDFGKRLYTLSGTLPESDALTRRAMAIVRTESTKIRNAASIGAATEAGYDRFVNVNEQPVSEVCKTANTLGPLTLEEWSTRGGGIPPRHPNCDSTLAPWVDAAPEVSEDEYQAALRQLVEAA